MILFSVEIRVKIILRETLTPTLLPHYRFQEATPPRTYLQLILHTVTLLQDLRIHINSTSSLHNSTFPLHKSLRHNSLQWRPCLYQDSRPRCPHHYSPKLRPNQIRSLLWVSLVKISVCQLLITSPNGSSRHNLNHLHPSKMSLCLQDLKQRPEFKAIMLLFR